jgi:hypothetical protein
LISALATAGPSAYWYLARGTGIVTLLLLTASVVLGILGSLRFSLAPRWPRFAIDSLHRDVSLLVIALLVVHIVTSVLDGFAPITLTDGVIPFASSYRPLWLGLGTLSFDILLALVLTSILRRRLGYSAWRAIHWLAYASWPVAVLHGLGTGSDAKAWWNLAFSAACVVAVLVAVWIRVVRSRPAEESLRVPALAATVLTPVGLAIFTVAGPLAPHWARRAGTPASLLPRTLVAASARARTAARATAPTTLKAPFSATLAGKVTQTQESGGAIVDLALRLGGGVRGRLRVRLAGAPLDGGGLSMTGSQVDLLAVGLPSVMEGQVVSLQGQQFLARVADASGSVLDLRANLNIDSRSGAVNGTLSATPAGGGG